MKPNIEPLESRTLFAAGGAGGLGGAAILARAEASADPAVQATLALVRADGAAIEAAKTQIREDSSDTRPALREVAAAGAELLAADKQAVLDARESGDAAALEAAREKLKADRQQVRDDIAAARSALRDNTADGRSALRDAMASLRTHLKQLRTDLRNAATGTNTAAPTNPAEGLRSPGVVSPVALESTSGVNEDQVRDVIDRVEDVVRNATPPDEDLVRTLVDHFTAAVDDGDLTDVERDQLRDDVRAVLSSANVSRDELRGIVDDVREIIRDSNLSWDDLAHAARIVGDAVLNG